MDCFDVFIIVLVATIFSYSSSSWSFCHNFRALSHLTLLKYNLLTSYLNLNQPTNRNSIFFGYV